MAAALHELAIGDAIVLECGGTSSNVSIVKGGRTALRTLRVMGHPTAIRSVDSWVVGAAGGSMARVRRRRVDDAGPRSAHVAGLPYACFAEPGVLEGARMELVAPVAGDPEDYAVVETRDGSRYAVTATCAARALGLVEGEREPALAAFAAIADATRGSAEDAARALLNAAVARIAEAVAEAARAHGFGAEVPVVALGGAGRALAPELARSLGRPCELPPHPEVLSSIGAALSLVRVELARHGGDSGRGAAPHPRGRARLRRRRRGAADGARRDALRAARADPARGRDRRVGARAGRRRTRRGRARRAAPQRRRPRWAWTGQRSSSSPRTTSTACSRATAPAPWRWSTRTAACRSPGTPSG